MPASNASASKRETSNSASRSNANANALARASKTTPSVRVGDVDVVRTREANGEVTYRPIDARTGSVIDARAFEQKKRELAEAERRDDPRADERESKKWHASTRAAIAKTRVEETRRMKREEAEKRERESGGVNPRRRARALGVVAPSKALEELRGEMRVAEAMNMRAKNVGRFQFLKAALDAEEEKHAKKVDEARKRDYAAARTRKGVCGDAGLDADLSSGDELENVNKPLIRGTLADLDDPDYRREPARAPAVKAPANAAPAAKGACRRCKLPGHFARDCMVIEEDLPELVAGVRGLDVAPAGEAKTFPKPNPIGAKADGASAGASDGKAKANGARSSKMSNVDADDPDYRRGPPQKHENLSQKPVVVPTVAVKPSGGRGGGAKAGKVRTTNPGVVVFEKDTSSG